MANAPHLIIHITVSISEKRKKSDRQTDRQRGYTTNVAAAAVARAKYVDDTYYVQSRLS